MSEHDDRYATPAAPRVAAKPGGAPMFNRAAWLRILPFAVYMAFIAIAELLTRAGAPPGVLRWLYPLKVGLVAVLLALFWRRYEELKRFSLAPAAILTALATGIVVLVLWVSLDAGWMVVGASPGYDPRVAGRIDWLLVAIRIAGAALVVPIMEELFWRSFLMRWIDELDFQTVEPPQLSLKSFSIAVLLFGFEHNLWLAGIVAGAAYSWLYMRFRNLWTPILAHAVTNGLLGLWVVQTGNWSFW
ncbi:CAAX prenyl protease-related protein [Massilia sp. 9096]|uniref:CAAX prenyl protease-related protein n=1 Tax=Massilia sp. 9096 TaxID=1500894 RepID=UPI000AAA6441|nr:CAAX prenyl protease-related protein [Massilia sp. 9096]